MKDHPSLSVKKVDDVVDLLDSLQAQLESCSFDHAKPELLSARLQSTIHLVNFWLTKRSTLDDPNRAKDLELQCHKLWNTCVRSRMALDTQRCEEHRDRRDTGLMSAWLLSFLCLELSQLCFNNTSSDDQARQATYSMGLMVPIVKASINELNFETARLALQRGAAHLDNLNLAALQGEKELPEDRTPFNLQAKYYAMRIWLLIWEITKSASALEQFDLVQFWCELALRPLFRCTTIQGVDRFFRKLLLCGMRRNELHIDDYETDVIPSFYGDDKLASTTGVHRGQELLYASLSRVSHGLDRELILSTLQYLLESCYGPGAETVNLPLLLRCSIRVLWMAEQDESEQIQDMNDASLASDTCSLFEIAAKYAVHDAANVIVNRRFTTQELDWFHQNSYNLGILTSSDWKSQFTARILNACLTFISCYSTDVALSQIKVAELALTTLRCHFVISARLIKQARTDDNDPSRLQHYQVMRQHIAEYGTTLQTNSLSFNAQTHHDLMIKYTRLLVYDFEAAMHLSQFTELRSIIELQKPLGNVQAYKAMGDILLQSSTPPEILLDTLKRIINEIFALEAFDVAKLAKYLQCLFQVLLPKNDTLALGVLDHFTQVSLESNTVGTPLPTVQLEWFVARAFNHALDHYVQLQEGACRDWASKAMKLAELMQDGGVLVQTLQARFQHLRFQNHMTPSTE
ncbi:hypothetical protein E4U55_003640 [Claviceps digitariae]|nr:hypothetical protein E4U55_003640 [Claviceps digitariae]